MQYTNMGPRRGEAPDGGARRAVQVRAWRSATAVDASTCYVLIILPVFPGLSRGQCNRGTVMQHPL